MGTPAASRENRIYSVNGYKGVWQELTANAGCLAADLIHIDEGLVLHLGDARADGRILEDVAEISRIREHGIDAQLRKCAGIGLQSTESRAIPDRTNLIQSGLQIGVELKLKLGQVDGHALPLPAILQELEVDALQLLLQLLQARTLVGQYEPHGHVDVLEEELNGLGIQLRIVGIVVPVVREHGGHLDGLVLAQPEVALLGVLVVEGACPARLEVDGIDKGHICVRLQVVHHTLDLALRLLLYPVVDALHRLRLLLKVEALHLRVEILVGHLAEMRRHRHVLSRIHLVGDFQHCLRLDVRMQQPVIALGEAILALRGRGVQRALQLGCGPALRSVVGQAQGQLHGYRRDDHVLLLAIGGQGLKQFGGKQIALLDGIGRGQQRQQRQQQIQN